MMKKLVTKLIINMREVI